MSHLAQSRHIVYVNITDYRMIPCTDPIPDLQRHLATRYRSRFQIFCLGRHERVGVASPVCVLVDDVIGLIFRFLMDGEGC